MIIGLIILIVVSFAGIQCSFRAWDYYMKRMNKPLFRGKIVRYCFIHYGTYFENDIRKDNQPLQLPAKGNEYAISKTALGLQIGNIVYFLIGIVFGILYIVHENTVVLFCTLGIAIIYFIVALMSYIMCTLKIKKVNRLIWEEKYNHLIQCGNKNNISIAEAQLAIIKGADVSFSLYGLDFGLTLYQPKKGNESSEQIQLVDFTHQKILMVHKNLDEILTRISVNGKSLKSLWKYLCVTYEK